MKRLTKDILMQAGGFILPNVNICTFTGNDFDRSMGPTLVLGGASGRALAVSGCLRDGIVLQGENDEVVTDGNVGDVC